MTNSILTQKPSAVNIAIFGEACKTESGLDFSQNTEVAA
jgi:hypothetical protein